MFGHETFPPVLRDAHPVVFILSHSVTVTSPIKIPLIFRDRAASFRVGGAKEECVKENFFFDIFSDIAIGSENSPSLN